VDQLRVLVGHHHQLARGLAAEASTQSSMGIHGLQRTVATPTFGGAMSKNIVEKAGEKVKGNVKEAVGYVTDDRDLEAEGQAEQGGKAGNQEPGVAINELDDTVSHQDGADR
jgi:uncharacterized protein YjbJ (UPF0337 family)